MNMMKMNLENTAEGGFEYEKRGWAARCKLEEGAVQREQEMVEKSYVNVKKRLFLFALCSEERRGSGYWKLAEMLSPEVQMEEWGENGEGKFKAK